MNNKGFTLVELIATILVLALLMSIGAYTIINTVNNVRKKNIESLVTQIKSAAENYVMECTYSKESVNEMFGVYEAGITSSVKNSRISSASTFCAQGSSNSGLPLSALVMYGYLTGNAKDATTNEYTLVNPNTDVSIADCTIKTKYDNKGKFVICGKKNNATCKAILPYDESC